MNLRIVCLFLVVSTLLTACSSVDIIHADKRHFTDRAIQFEKGGVIAKASALSDRESSDVFGAALNLIGIQPVWISIENQNDHEFLFFPIAVDSNYFPAYEVATRASVVAGHDKHDLYELLEKHQFPRFVSPNASAQGFVYTHADEGMKAFNLELHSPHQSIKHAFVVPVPGMPADYFDLDPVTVYEDEHVIHHDLGQLRDWVSSLPCCTKNPENKQGDPMNVIFVGSLKDLRNALISRHWDVTAPVTKNSLIRMFSAFVFGSRYRYAPISKLYLLEREHDLAFQKSRSVIDERNHMRLWLAPVLHEGKNVWLGQVSRDVGVKLTGRLWPPTTHVIDPDVDDARFYLFQDLLEGNAITQLGYVKTNSHAAPKSPLFNAEGDPYFTDGLTAIFFLAETPARPNDLIIHHWELPKKLEQYLQDK